MTSTLSRVARRGQSSGEEPDECEDGEEDLTYDCVKTGPSAALEAFVTDRRTGTEIVER